jgi:hypothetical protein
MSNFEDDLKTAVQHAGAWVLLELQKLQRGYTSLHPNEDVVTQGVALAHSEAQARGVPAAEVSVNPGHVIAAAQTIGASGADPAVVAAETKSADGPTAEEVKANEPLQVASTAHDPAPPGAVVEGANEAAIQQGAAGATDIGSTGTIDPSTGHTPAPDAA